MNILKKILSIEKRLPLTLGGLALTVFFGGTGFYFFYYEKKTNLSFITTAEINVLDIKESIEDLEIYFRGRDIRKEKLSLRVVKIAIINDGETNILSDQYDVSQPFGFYMLPGRIISIRNFWTNADYLKGREKDVKVHPNGFVELPKTLIDKGDYILLDTLVLHHTEQAHPKLIASGKISGMKNFNVREPEPPAQRTGIFQLAFGGSPGIQILRFIGYLVGGVLATVALIAAGVWLLGIGDSRKRKQRVIRASELRSSFPEKELSWLFDYYTNFGSGAFITLEKAFRLQRTLMQIYEEFHNATPAQRAFLLHPPDDRIHREIAFDGITSQPHKELIFNAIEMGLIQKRGRSIEIEPRLRLLISAMLKLPE